MDHEFSSQTQYRAVLTPEQFWLWRLLELAMPTIGLSESAAPDFVARARACRIDRYPNTFNIVDGEVLTAIEFYTGELPPHHVQFRTVGEAFDWMKPRLTESQRRLTLAYPAGRCRTQAVFYRLRRAVQDVEPFYRHRATLNRPLPKMCPITALWLCRRVQTELELDWLYFGLLGGLIEVGVGFGFFPGWRLWLPFFKPPTFSDLTRFVADCSRWGLVEMSYDQCLPVCAPHVKA